MLALRIRHFAVLFKLTYIVAQFAALEKSWINRFLFVFTCDSRSASILLGRSKTSLEVYVKGSFVTAGCAIVIALCVACQGPTGLTGATGPAGSAGPTIYLTDGSARVYSGGILDLGSLPNGTTPATPKALQLSNETGVALNVTKTNNMAVSPTSGYFIRDSGISNTWDMNSPPGAHGIQLGDIWVTQDMAASSILQGSSAPFDMIFDPLDTPLYQAKGESHQDYDIALSDGSGNKYNFVFEVYGVVSC